MAQTKRKRQMKHRGNAAGMVETRGRTGRKPDPVEKKKLSGQEARLAKLNSPPTWRGAAGRSAIATAIFLAVVILLFKQPARSAVALAGFVFLLYIPLGYYTDLMLYRRRMRKQGRPDATRTTGRSAPRKKG